jgi:hypothetical protein
MRISCDPHHDTSTIFILHCKGYDHAPHITLQSKARIRNKFYKKGSMTIPFYGTNTNLHYIKWGHPFKLKFKVTTITSIYIPTRTFI